MPPYAPPEGQLDEWVNSVLRTCDSDGESLPEEEETEEVEKRRELFTRLSKPYDDWFYGEFDQRSEADDKVSEADHNLEEAVRDLAEAEAEAEACGVRRSVK